MKQRRLDYNIELMKLANKIKENDEEMSEDSEEPVGPNYTNIGQALKVLQFIIDNDEDIHLKFSNTDGQNNQSGSTKDILIKVKNTLESGIFDKNIR